jgi:hypothetical protein
MLGREANGMATALLTWELGGGLGHLHNLLPAARGLHSLGHRVVLALQDVTKAKQVLGEEFTREQALLSLTVARLGAGIAASAGRPQEIVAGLEGLLSSNGCGVELKNLQAAERVLPRLERLLIT